MDEFINVFLEAEDILSSKIKDLRNSIEDLHRQRNEAFIKLEEIKSSESLNSYGIAQNSHLQVIALQINQIPNQEYDSFYLLFECGEQSYKTNLCSFFDPRIDFSTTLYTHTRILDKYILLLLISLALFKQDLKMLVSL